jgi:hypothetical protein
MRCSRARALPLRTFGVSAGADDEHSCGNDRTCKKFVERHADPRLVVSHASGMNLFCGENGRLTAFARGTCDQRLDSHFGSRAIARSEPAIKINVRKRPPRIAALIMTYAAISLSAAKGSPSPVIARSATHKPAKTAPMTLRTNMYASHVWVHWEWR